MNKKATLTKQDLVEAVFEKMAVSKVEANAWVELIFETIKSGLSVGEDVKLSGFGKFSVRKKNARPGRNPKTGETIEISARRVVGFHASPVLRAGVAAEVPEGGQQ
ncbi:integration host factor subunit alpha [Bdellovibrionota bacterium FG-2]